MAAQDETADKRTPEQISKYWQEQLALAEKDQKDFVDNGKKVVARYKGDRDKLKSVRVKKLNILYSNTEVLRAALYGKSAKPDVRRRFGVEDAVAGEVAEVLEKSLVYCAEAYDSDKPIELAILDYLLPGRGIARIEYNPVMGQHQGKDYITDQEVYECYVYWEDFLHMPARTWDDILKNGWISFRHKMSRRDCVANFGEDIGNAIPLNWMPDLANKKDVPESLKKAEVYEIWDVTDRKRYWIVKGFDKPCRIDDDPYGLEQFFPLPEPLAFYVTTDTIVPEPEFHVYSDQADDLDEIIARISRLTKALKRRGVYDQSIKELQRLANAGDNQFIPVENYQNLVTKGGLQAAFQTEDIKVIAEVLIQLYNQRDMLVQAIWEQVGIADIMRGSSQASETLGAQQLKAQFGSQRLKRRQRAVQKWVRDLLKLKAEIIAEHFEPAVIEQMTGVKLTPVTPQPTGNPQQDQVAQQQAAQQNAKIQQIIQVLRTDKLRSYRIDIETDSTVFEDAEQEKKSRSELITALTSFVTGWGPIIQQERALAPVGFELLKFGLGAFKSTRAIEDAIEQAAGAFEQAAQQPKPDPEQQRMQAEMAIKKQETDIKLAQAQQQAQIEQGKVAHEAELKERETASKLQAEQQKLEIEREKAALQMQIEREKMQLEREKMDMEREKLVTQSRFEALRLKQQAAADKAKTSLEVRKAKAGLAVQREGLNMKRAANG